MSLDAVSLSRLQFALTATFHYLFVPLTIGMGGVLVILEALHLKTRQPIYEAAVKFWVKLFAISFALGVATGIVMEFQFGTNWATYSRFVGDVFGSALAAEGIFAFFLESGFLAVLVFGWDKVSPRMHFFSTVMVAGGSIFSALWIVVANSWQQTPAGYHLVATPFGTRAEITSFWAVVFNPSAMIRLTHVLIGAFILGACFVMSISAWYLLKKKHEEFARRSFTVALWFAAVFSLAALVTGDLHAREVAKYQPAKLAAFEGHFHSSGAAGLALFGIPDPKADKLDASISIPGGLSLLLHSNAKAPVTGLDSFAPRDRPPLGVFYSFHLMVGLGVFFIVLTLFGLVMLWRKKLFTQRWLLWVFTFSILAAYAANDLGWISADVGRQPWVVQGLLRTSDAVSTTVPPGQILASIALFGVVYLLLFALWIFVMNDRIQRGPEAVEQPASAIAGSPAAGQLEPAAALSIGQES